MRQNRKSAQRVASLRRGLGAALLGLCLLSCQSQSESPGGAGDTVVVVLTTDLGPIELALYPERAPITAANFLAYVDQGLYDGASFYRVVRPDNDPTAAPIEVVQGGLMGDLFRFGSTAEIESDRPGLAPIAHETTEQTGIDNSYGVVAMARREPGTASAEFFVNLADNLVLNTGATARNPDAAGYATFGRVVAGMAVLERIQDLPTNDPKRTQTTITSQVLNRPVVIRSARRKDATR